MDWVIWRPVKEGLGRLEEIETQWTLLDLLKAHRALDADAEARARAQQGRELR